jgi:hypothetical protein
VHQQLTQANSVVEVVNDAAARVNNAASQVNNAATEVRNAADRVGEVPAPAGDAAAPIRSAADKIDEAAVAVNDAATEVNAAAARVNAIAWANAAAQANGVVARKQEDQPDRLTWSMFLYWFFGGTRLRKSPAERFGRFLDVLGLERQGETDVDSCVGEAQGS